MQTPLLIQMTVLVLAQDPHSKIDFIFILLPIFQLRSIKLEFGMLF